jgi:hypothetical protein
MDSRRAELGAVDLRWLLYTAERLGDGRPYRLRTLLREELEKPNTGYICLPSVLGLRIARQFPESI